MEKRSSKPRLELKPYGPVIQICPNCGKVDVYKDDGHDCGQERINQEAREYIKPKKFTKKQIKALDNQTLEQKIMWILSKNIKIDTSGFSREPMICGFFKATEELSNLLEAELKAQILDSE